MTPSRNILQDWSPGYGEIYGIFCFLLAHPLLVSGEQRVNMAKAKVKQNYGQLEKEFQKQKAEMKSNDASAKIDVSNIRIKEEPVSDEEPMDTSAYEGMNNGIVNGLHAEEDSTDSLNGHLPGGCIDRVAQELKAFVSSTFKKQFVLTLSELKRLFNLHLASLPPGHTLFSGISDKMLQDMVLDTGCKQILVPVSMFFPGCTLGRRDWGAVKHLSCEMFVSCAGGLEEWMCTKELSSTGYVEAAGGLSAVLLLAGPALCFLCSVVCCIV